jgi:mono/diheme cytochrome c family protein
MERRLMIATPLEVLQHLTRAGVIALVMTAMPAAAVAQDGTNQTGGQVFLGAHCNICHGQMGSGGAGPALRDNPMLRVTDYVVAQILVGGGLMPPFADKLSDQQIAAVASYIRTSWGNNDGTVNTAAVGKVRDLLTQKHALPVAQEGE